MRKTLGGTEARVAIRVYQLEDSGRGKTEGSPWGKARKKMVNNRVKLI